MISYPSPRGFKRMAGCFLAAAAATPAMPSLAAAHVKWFSEFSFADPPLTLPQVLTPTFFGLALLGAGVIGAFVVLDRRLAEAEWYGRINHWLSDRSDRSTLVMRIGAGVVLLLSWQADAMLVPELGIRAAWIGWFQFVLAALLLFERTVPLAGLGLGLLYLLGVGQVGVLHMLDYLLYLGAGYFLLVSNASDARVRASGLPALYLTVGLSLCWVALEKVVYPQWGLYVLQQNPQLALGFELDFFLVGAAFVEFSLGYLLIINLLQRPMALVVTLVFFSTTLVFGKVEVIGHTLIHAALIVFLLEGPGRVFLPPIALHRTPGLRVAFASVNFLLLLALLLLPYTQVAAHEYRSHVAREVAELGSAAPATEARTPLLPGGAPATLSHPRFQRATGVAPRGRAQRPPPALAEFVP